MAWKAPRTCTDKSGVIVPLSHVGFVPKADINRVIRDVRFVPILLQKSVEGFREQ